MFGRCYCPKSKVIDFSLDGDMETDANGSYTYASLQKESFPSSFTICAAFMVEQWRQNIMNSPLFVLLDDKNKTWLDVSLYSAFNDTEFTVVLSEDGFTVQSPLLFFPMQWTRFCFSFNSSTSLATLVVDGDQLTEKTIVVNRQPLNLNMILGFDNTWFESF